MQRIYTQFAPDFTDSNVQMKHGVEGSKHDNREQQHEFLQRGFADTPPQILFRPVATDCINQRLACFTFGLKSVLIPVRSVRDGEKQAKQGRTRLTSDLRPLCCMSKIVIQTKKNRICIDRSNEIC